MSYYHSAPDAARRDKERLDDDFYTAFDAEEKDSPVRVAFDALVADETKRVLVQQRYGRLSDEERDIAVADLPPSISLSGQLREMTEYHDSLLDFRYAVAHRLVRARPDLLSAEYDAAKMQMEKIANEPQPNLIDRFRESFTLGEWQKSLPINAREKIPQQEMLLDALAAHDGRRWSWQIQENNIGERQETEIGSKEVPVIPLLNRQEKLIAS